MTNVCRLKKTAFAKAVFLLGADFPVDILITAAVAGSLYLPDETRIANNLAGQDRRDIVVVAADIMILRNEGKRCHIIGQI